MLLKIIELNIAVFLHNSSFVHTLRHTSNFRLLPSLVDGTVPTQDGSRHGNLYQPHLVRMPVQKAASLHH